MKQQRLFVGLAVFAAILSAAYLFFYFSARFRSPVGPGADKPQFHPDSVLEFKWTVEGESFSYQRENRMQQWSPTTNPPQNIQDRLVLLSQIYQAKAPPAKSAFVQIHLKLDNHTDWEGTWDGEWFRWSSGPAQGLGRKLTPIENRLFLAGHLAFQERKFNWCPARFKRVKITDTKNSAVTIEEKNGAWIAQQTSAAQATHPAHTTSENSTFMEQWMGRHCLIQFDQPIDRALYEKIVGPLSARQTQLQLDFDFNDANSAFQIYAETSDGYGDEIILNTTKGSQLFYADEFKNALLGLRTQFDQP